MSLRMSFRAKNEREIPETWVCKATLEGFLISLCSIRNDMKRPYFISDIYYQPMVSTIVLLNRVRRTPPVLSSIGNFNPLCYNIVD